VVTKPAQYLGDVMFDTKFALVIVASVAMLYFHITFKREVVAWEAARDRHFAVASRSPPLLACCGPRSPSAGD